MQVTFPRFATHATSALSGVLTHLSGAPLDVDVALAGQPLPFRS